MEEFSFLVNDEPVLARPGQTVAAALIAAGHLVLRHTSRGAPRGLYCGMGVCFECLVEVDGTPGLQACLTPVRPGMRVKISTEEQPAAQRPE